MVQTAADVLVETLIDWEVEVVFGLPGDGINGIMEALRKRQNDIRFIQVRHEEAAAFMACVTPSIRADLAYVWPPPGPAAFICSTDSTMQKWMANRFSPLPDTIITI